MEKIIDYRIVISKDARANERRASCFLSEKIKVVCGKKPLIVTDDFPATDLEIVIGKTNREEQFNVNFERESKELWGFKILTKNKRVFIAGMGVEPTQIKPYNNSYLTLNDGAVGTVLGVYHFIVNVLKYDFIYALNSNFIENPNLTIPKDYSYDYTTLGLTSSLPEKFDGASIYSLPRAFDKNANMQSFIIRTKNGKIIVIDGGFKSETAWFFRSLQEITGQKKPHVDAWFLTHLHDDHYSVYKELCTNASYSNKITVDTFYHHLCSKDFYTVTGKEKSDVYGNAYDEILSSTKTITKDIKKVEVGEMISVDEVVFEILHTPDESLSSVMNINDSSIVFKMTYDKSQTWLFLNDAEWVCDNDLVKNMPTKLKSDVVQVGHHGCGSVSKKCYELIGAQVYFWCISKRFWYGETGEGLNTHNIGVERTRIYMQELGVKIENSIVNSDKIFASKLPIEIK